MVKNVTSVTNLTRNGLADWVVQRFTAILLLIYTPIIVGFFVFAPEVNFVTLNAFFGQYWVKILNVLIVLSISAHAWIGLWTISTDYMPKTSIRLIFQTFFILALFVFTVWSIDVFWRF